MPTSSRESPATITSPPHLGGDGTGTAAGDESARTVAAAGRGARVPGSGPDVGVAAVGGAGEAAHLGARPGPGLPANEASRRAGGLETSLGRTTATGHRVGGRYYSVRHRTCYEVLGVATRWELAPDTSVRLRWDNGNTTTSAIDRGPDPEVCPACGHVVGGPAWLELARCACLLRLCGRAAS